MPARTKQYSTDEQQLAVDRAAYSIVEFAQAHGMSRAHLYNIIRDGLGPITMRVGRRRLISREAAESWRRRMEAASEGSER